MFYLVIFISKFHFNISIYFIKFLINFKILILTEIINFANSMQYLRIASFKIILFKFYFMY